MPKVFGQFSSVPRFLRSLVQRMLNKNLTVIKRPKSSLTATCLKIVTSALTIGTPAIALYTQGDGTLLQPIGAALRFTRNPKVYKEIQSDIGSTKRRGICNSRL